MQALDCAYVQTQLPSKHLLKLLKGVACVSLVEDMTDRFMGFSGQSCSCTPVCAGVYVRCCKLKSIFRRLWQVTSMQLRSTQYELQSTVSVGRSTLDMQHNTTVNAASTTPSCINAFSVGPEGMVQLHDRHMCGGVQDYLPPAMHEAFLAISTEFVLLPWRHATRTALQGASQGGSQASGPHPCNLS